MFLGGHDKDVILRKKNLAAMGNDGGDATSDGYYPEGEFIVHFGYFFEIPVGHRRKFVDTRGQKLYFTLGDVYNFVTGIDLNESDNLLGHQFFGMDEKIEF
jgi:hypothetical protein